MLSSQDSFLNTSSPWKSIKFRMESKRRRNEAPIIRPTNPPHPYSALERPNVSCRETARRYVLPRVTGPIHVHQITSETVDAARARLTGDKFPASALATGKYEKVDPNVVSNEFSPCSLLERGSRRARRTEKEAGSRSTSAQDPTSGRRKPRRRRRSLQEEEGRLE